MEAAEAVDILVGKTEFGRPLGFGRHAVPCAVKKPASFPEAGPVPAEPKALSSLRLVRAPSSAFLRDIQYRVVKSRASF